MSQNRDKKEKIVNGSARICVDSPHVLMRDFDSVSPKIFSESSPSLLLGNGFNMSVGVETGGHQLGKALAEIPAIKKALTREELNKLHGQPGLDIEDFISDLGSEKEKIAKPWLFKLIIRRCARDVKNKPGVMDFLTRFRLVFTTNYDTVLYFLMVSIDKGDLPPNNGGKHTDKQDGFGRYKESNKLEWPGSTPNYFYLHGAFHIYVRDFRNYKREAEGIDGLGDTLEKHPDDHIAVFQSDCKLWKINRNIYLLSCYDSLKRLSGSLCIIGWRCASKDAHLVKAIRESSANPIYAAVHLDPSKCRKSPNNYLDISRDIEALETIRNFRHYFPNKKIVFFESGGLDYLNPTE